MGCNCGGGRSAARAMGTAPASPMIFGEDNQSLPIRRVVLLEGSNGIPAGATRYVRGSLVDDLIVQNKLRLVN